MALTQISIRRLPPRNKPYRVADGKGLALLVHPNGSKYWQYRYRFDGKGKLLALGVWPETGLAEAREKLLEARRQVAEGIDPGLVRKLRRSIGPESTAAGSFKAIAEEWFGLYQERWSESNRTRTWRLLTRELFPWLGARPIGQISAPEVLAALRRIESRGARDTAKRTRQIASQVFRYAIAVGRSERDPAQQLAGVLAPKTVRHRAAVILSEAEMLPMFLALQLQSNHGRNYLLSCAKGSTGLSTLNSAQLKVFPVLAPPIEEQRAITEAIANWNIAVQKTEQLIAAKAKRKAGLMAELLTGRRRIGRFQTEWRRWNLGELFQERVETNRNDLPLLSITREDGVVPRNGLDRKDTSNEDKSKYLRICPGDIGYNTMRMWQGVSALSCHEGIVSPAYTVCIPSPEIDGKFASYLFKLPEIIHLFYRYSQGLTSDTWNLKFHHFATIQVHIPEPKEQIAIASILSTLDEELALLKQQREALAQQKRALMQMLLTGQWRLPRL